MRKTLTLLIWLFVVAAPLAWSQDDPGSDDEQMLADDESDAVADEPVDEQADSDASAEDSEPADEMAEPEAEEDLADEPSGSDEPEDSSADQEASAEEEEEEQTEDSSSDEDSVASDDAPAEAADREEQATGAAEAEAVAEERTQGTPPAPTPTPPPPGGDQGTAGNGWPTARLRFLVDFGMGETEFQEVSGLDAEAQIIEYRAGNSPTFSTVKMPGLAKYGNITLKKGIFKDKKGFWDLYNKIKTNQVERRTVTIKLLDESGAPVMTWTLANAWPTKISGTDLKSTGNETAVEFVEFAHSGVTRGD